MNTQPTLPSFVRPSNRAPAFVKDPDAYAVEYAGGAATFHATGRTLAVVRTYQDAQLADYEMRGRHYRLTAATFGTRLYAHDARGWHYAGSVQAIGVADLKKTHEYASAAAAAMGAMTSPAKAAAARKNGQLGGRPRKVD